MLTSSSLVWPRLWHQVSSGSSSLRSPVVRKPATGFGGVGRPAARARSSENRTRFQPRCGGPGREEYDGCGTGRGAGSIGGVAGGVAGAVGGSGRPGRPSASRGTWAWPRARPVAQRPVDRHVAQVDPQARALPGDIAMSTTSGIISPLKGSRRCWPAVPGDQLSLGVVDVLFERPRPRRRVDDGHLGRRPVGRLPDAYGSPTARPTAGTDPGAAGAGSSSVMPRASISQCGSMGSICRAGLAANCS